MRLPAIVVLACALAGCGEPRGTAQGPEPSAAVREDGVLFAISARDSGGTWLAPSRSSRPAGCAIHGTYLKIPRSTPAISRPGRATRSAWRACRRATWRLIAAEEAVCNERLARDALDVDGDGTTVLIAQTTYCESWNYTVLRRTQEG